MICDFGVSNTGKLSWVLEDKKELIDILQTLYRDVKKGRGLAVGPKDTLHAIGTR
jgi:U5 snRNP protein, DIM1 family